MFILRCKFIITYPFLLLASLVLAVTHKWVLDIIFRLGRRGAGVSPGRPRVSDRDQRDEDSRRMVRSPLKQTQTRSRSRLRSLSKARSRSKLRSRSRHHSPPPSIRRVHSMSKSADRVTTMKAVVKREVSTRSRTRTPPRPRSVHRRTSKSPPSAVIKPYRETAIPTDRCKQCWVSLHLILINFILGTSTSFFKYIIYCSNARIWKQKELGLHPETSLYSVSSGTCAI